MVTNKKIKKINYKVYKSNLDTVGNTPIVNISNEVINNIDIYAKLEFYNPSGSVKDRAASYILQKLIKLGKINKDTTIIESSSGNFGVALATYCNQYKLKFICIVDPHISSINKMLIESFGGIAIQVNALDNSGGYLINRIKKVKELLSSIENSYWINQYENPYNAEAYYVSLGEEICNEINPIDYVFLGVSSGGTITGVSRKVKKHYPNAKIIAVDICGSVIFGDTPKNRCIPGIGSSIIPNILKQAKIDDVVMMNEIETIKECHNLLKKENIFAGGSSGSVFGAITKYFKQTHVKQKTNVVGIFADRGERYINTIYSNEWCSNFFNNNVKKI